MNTTAHRFSIQPVYVGRSTHATAFEVVTLRGYNVVARSREFPSHAEALTVAESMGAEQDRRLAAEGLSPEQIRAALFA